MPEWLKALLLSAAIILGIAFIVFMTELMWPAHAREGGDWSQAPPEVREWIKSLHRPDLWDGRTASCCGEGDAYFADKGEIGEDGKAYAVITDNRGNPLPVGTRLEIRQKSIQNKEGNPTDHVVVFANESGYVFCFIPNGAL